MLSLEAVESGQVFRKRKRKEKGKRREIYQGDLKHRRQWSSHSTKSLLRGQALDKPARGQPS